MLSLKTEAPAGRIVAAYDYTDDKGALLYQVCRLEPKSFRQRRPDGKGWIWSVKDCRRFPYRLTDLQKYPDATVFVCEGEKDADRVASLGYCATTVACDDWTDDCVRALAGRDCVIDRIDRCLLRRIW
jgi:putative DNA primase/helicase